MGRVTVPNFHEIRDLLGAYVLTLVWIAFLGAGFVGIAYLFLAGFGDCPDPWQGCDTMMGVVE